MNRQVDVHPEDLLDRECEGSLTTDERRRLEEHSAQCVPCALLRGAAADFARERAPSEGDDLLMRNLLAKTLGQVESAPPVESARTVGRGRRKRSPWAAAAILMFAATGATASFLSVRRFAFQHAQVNTVLTSPAAAIEVPKVAARPKSEPREPLVAPPEPPITAEPIKAPPPPITAPPRPPKVIEEVAPVPLTAGQLFANANDARRRGDSAQALRLYQDLQQQFPGTREEKTSSVLLGRLLLDRGEDPTRALNYFTRYLEESPNGTLAEEARLGRALALKRLGRPTEERQAWQQLLAAHPNSIHAERAAKRLDELR